MSSEQLKRFTASFSNAATSCSWECDCGRIHFVSSEGHGDYEEGQLRQLQNLAEIRPDGYSEETIKSSIPIARIMGMELVPGCPCGKAERIASLVEDDYENIAAYIRDFLDEKEDIRKAEAEIDSAVMQSIPKENYILDWKHMSSAPKHGALIEVKLPDNSICIAHHACDLSGEEGPSINGWFCQNGDNGSFVEIEPQLWRDCTR